MKPIAPAIAVAVPTEAAVPKTARNWTLRMSTPMLEAASEPSVSTSSGRASMPSITQPASMNGADSHK